MREWKLIFAAVALVPAAALAQGGDTSMNRQQPTAQSPQTQDTTQSAAGAVAPERSRNRSLGLSRSQVQQLQQAINNSGCDAGPPDGVLGARTRAGLACVHREKNVSGNNLNDVFRALNVGFTASDSTFDPSWENQTQSGVVNARTGRSTLGPNVKKLRPIQGHRLEEPYKKGARSTRPDTGMRAPGDTARTTAADSSGKHEAAAVRYEA